MDGGIGSQRHFTIFNLAYHRSQFAFLFPVRVRAKFTKVKFLLSFVDMVFQEPTNRLHPAVPGIVGVIAMTIVAGSSENLCHLFRVSNVFTKSVAGIVVLWFVPAGKNCNPTKTTNSNKPVIFKSFTLLKFPVEQCHTSTFYSRNRDFLSPLMYLTMLHLYCCYTSGKKAGIRYDRNLRWLPGL